MSVTYTPVGEQDTKAFQTLVRIAGAAIATLSIALLAGLFFSLWNPNLDLRLRGSSESPPLSPDLQPVCPLSPRRSTPRLRTSGIMCRRGFVDWFGHLWFLESSPPRRISSTNCCRHQPSLIQKENVR